VAAVTTVEREVGRREDDERFADAFDTLAQAIRRARGARQDDARALSFSQYALLQALAGGRAARVRDLALEAGIAPSTATRILDALERREIVSRTRAEHDRRGVTVTLTALGCEALGRQQAWMRDRQRAFFAALPVSEQALAPDLLVRLAGLIDELAVGPS
jgi:DNA-binding MarR family transcriptional regulator